jgi:stalled ribosome alternative rescue factor ArfA
MPVPSGKRRARPGKRTGQKMKAKRTLKRRSAAAAALASPLYRKRVVRSAKAYRRKGKTPSQGDESEEA